jgi:hypothetical protein
MSWYIESLLGTSSDARKQALGKLPAEVVSLLESRGLSKVSGPSNKSVRLPEELMEMVRTYFDAEGNTIPMSLEEAKEHRANLMRERGAFRETANDGWERAGYNFCEH